MSARKWSTLLVISIIITLGMFAGVMYYTDPLLQYGAECGPLTSYEYTEMYSNPGIAQHYEYDTVLVGTSMIENTDIDEFDKLMNCNAVRLPYSGGTTYNMRTILDVCFKSDNDIKDVYWELDEFQLLGSATEPRYPLPEYLYRDDTKEDASYLLNLDIFYHYVILNVFHTLQGQEQPAERRGETLFGDFSKESVLAGYVRKEQSHISSNATNIYKEKVDANLNTNIIPLIKENPDTTFTFYFVPFSILYWEAEYRGGTFDNVMDAVQYAMSELLEYQNVKIYFYHNEKDIITNLDNYKDYSHYGKWVNSYMTKAMSNGEKRVTKENYVQYVDDMRIFVKTYDFEALLQNKY